jgi:uncharacterized cupredoxin-like copper-binding protein
MRKRLLFFLMASLAVASVLAACGGASSGPVTVNITAKDFKFETSQTTFQVGVPYHFVVKNEGTVPHEIMIMEPMEGTGMDMEEMDALALAHIEADELEPGDTATLDYTFEEAAPEGTLEFACHVKGHYEQEMRLPIVVR